eukprot:scaffold1376_cov257-Pinguiococcus_pyrenoidosus.AAC.19
MEEPNKDASADLPLHDLLMDYHDPGDLPEQAPPEPPPPVPSPATLRKAGRAPGRSGQGAASRKSVLGSSSADLVDYSRCLETSVSLPRVRKMMHCIEDSGATSRDALYLVAKAMDLFVVKLVRETSKVARNRQANDVNTDDILELIYGHQSHWDLGWLELDFPLVAENAGAGVYREIAAAAAAAAAASAAAAAASPAR